MDSLGATIKRIRKGYGSSIAEVAAETGLSRSYLYDIESGRTNPSLDSLTKIQRALETGIFMVCESPLSTDEFALLQFWGDRDYGSMLRMIATALQEGGKDQNKNEAT